MKFSAAIVRDLQVIIQRNEFGYLREACSLNWPRMFPVLAPSSMYSTLKKQRINKE
jgi:hypothetical protein